MYILTFKWKKYLYIDLTSWSRYLHIDLTSWPRYLHIDLTSWSRYLHIDLTSWSRYLHIDLTSWSRYLYIHSCPMLLFTIVHTDAITNSIVWYLDDHNPVCSNYPWLLNTNNFHPISFEILVFLLLSIFSSLVSVLCTIHFYC